MFANYAWEEQKNEDGTPKEVPRVSLPLQVIETVNESRASREAKKGGVQEGLFEVYDGKEGDTFQTGWQKTELLTDMMTAVEAQTRASSSTARMYDRASVPEPP